jgi:hypothetical protein
MRSLNMIALRLWIVAVVLTVIGSNLRPFPGFLADAVNVLTCVAAINLLVSFDMRLRQRRSERRELENSRARYVAAMEEQNGPMQLMMLPLPLDPPSLYIRCEIHGVRPRPTIHYHSGPPEYVSDSVTVPQRIRACDEECAPCPACGEYHPERS